MNQLLFFSFLFCWTTGLAPSIPLFLLGIFLIKTSIDRIKEATYK